MRQNLLRIFWFLLLAALLYWALKNAPLTEIWSTLSQLQLWQIAMLAGINVGIYALVTLRWWIITQAEAKRVPYLPLLFVRVAVFGVSYFTLGPQVGGEPLQVLALRHRYGLTINCSSSSPTSSCWHLD
jgi:glycosyltransferase 2 family protein